MKYILIIFMSGFSGAPVAESVGPFSSILACEAAAVKAEMVFKKTIGADKRVGTVCVEQQIQVLVLPKGVKK